MAPIAAGADALVMVVMISPFEARYQVITGDTSESEPVRRFRRGAAKTSRDRKNMRSFRLECSESWSGCCVGTYAERHVQQRRHGTTPTAPLHSRVRRSIRASRHPQRTP